MFSSQVTKLEIELVSSKQQLGDALNTIHEMETLAVNGNVFDPNLLRESRKISPERASEESKGSDSFGSNQSSGQRHDLDQNINYDDTNYKKS